MKRNETFLEHLYKEKEIHKEHRFRHVIFKMALTGSFFGLGHFPPISTSESLPNFASLFLYVVPFIAFVHDFYIAAEHFKVQRVGLFIRNLVPSDGSSVCPEEVTWENFTKDRRETWAFKASLAYSFIISGFSALSLYMLLKSDIPWYFWGWAVLCFVLFVIVMVRAADTGLTVELNTKTHEEKARKDIQGYIDKLKPKADPNQEGKPNG